MFTECVDKNCVFPYCFFNSDILVVAFGVKLLLFLTYTVSFKSRLSFRRFLMEAIASVFDKLNMTCSRC